MKKFLKTIFELNKKKSSADIAFARLSATYEIKKLFECFKNFSENSEIRFVGGCVRKILNNERVDDIDLATNTNPNETIQILSKNNIKYIKTGIEHGTVTAIINKKKFEITSLRKDINTDGRHAKVEFSKDWYEDAKRRDFTINSIYADNEGNLYDPFNGKDDLKKGLVKFIGDPDERIKEDYLRILRYVRFFAVYSLTNHETEIIKSIKKNISGIKKISKERLIDELKKIFLSFNFINISKDEFSIEVLKLIFPELAKISIIKKFSTDMFNLLSEKDFIFLLSLFSIDNTDNSDYFLFKHHLSNHDKNRIKLLNKNYSNIFDKKFLSEKNLMQHYYHNGKTFIIDLIDLKILNSKSINKSDLNLRNYFIKKEKPIFPIKAKKLIEEFNLTEGKKLGEKLKKLENIWINNDFKLSKKEIEQISKD